MFRGNHQTRVDEKFRLKLPAEFKRRVDEVYGPQFYITSMNGESARLYPMKEWEAIEAKIVQLEPTDESRELFQRVTSYYGQVTELDSQGRLLLPQVLRQEAGLTGDVNVLGMLTYLDVTSIERFQTENKGAGGKVEMTRDKQTILAEKTKALKG
ncbi:MAG: division/cell wall cluster transcriptional repressor MraZ [Acidobacteriaceae bacterium]|jgi:MraZ protein